MRIHSDMHLYIRKARGYFAPRTLCPTDILPQGHFATRLFPQTFCPNFLFFFFLWYNGFNGCKMVYNEFNMTIKYQPVLLYTDPVTPSKSRCRPLLTSTTKYQPVLLYTALHPVPGWQKLCGSTGGTRRKVWTRTKILSPNIRYFVAN